MPRIERTVGVGVSAAEACGGGWKFSAVDSVTTDAVWRYTFTIRPRLLAVVGDRVGRWLLGRDIEARIEAFAAACADRDIVAAAIEQTGIDSGTTVKPDGSS